MTVETGPTLDADDIKAVPVRHPGRWAAAIVIGVLAAMLLHSMIENPRWGWHYIGHYAFTGPVLHGVVVTIWLTAASMAIGIIGGILLAVMRLSANPVLSSVSWIYILAFRGTPVLVQLFIWYNLAYLFPRLGVGIPFGPTFVSQSTNVLIPTLVAAVLALGLNEAAYMAEIVRSGILSVDDGQSEAAGALGMSRLLVMRRIVLPQAMRVIIPPTGNETISMLKTTALVSVIAGAELFQQTQNIINTTYVTVPLLIMASLWYLAMTTVLTIGQYYIERHYGRGSTRNPQPTFLSLMGQSLSYRQPQRNPGGAT